MTTEQFIDVPPTDIQPNPRQPRTVFDETGLNDLAASIQTHGIKQPLRIMYSLDAGGAKYTLIMGERRWRAAAIAGLTSVPCVIEATEPDAQQLLEWAVIENVQRADLSPADEARAYVRLRTEFKLTDEQIGQRVGKAPATIRGIRRLAELPEAVLALIGDGDGQLKMRDARRLIPVSRLVTADALAKTATTIATLDPTEKRQIDRLLRLLVEKTSQVMTGRNVSWDRAWPGKPIEVTTPAGPLTIPACTGCECFLKLAGEYGGETEYCLKPECYAAKGKLFAEHELVRVSEKLGIPVVSDGEKAPVLTIGNATIDKARKWVANPPKHLRVSLNANPKRTDGYYHANLTESPVVFLASTNPSALADNPAANAGSGKVVTGGVASSISSGTLSKDAIAQETAEDKSARLKREEQARQEQAEAERKELLAHWKVCGLKRKALADANWLVVNTASKLAPKVPLTGLWLEIFANQVEDDYVEFDSASIRLDEIDKELHKSTKTAEREALLREKVMLLLICDGSPSEDDWPGVKKHVTEFVTGKPGQNGAGGLGIKYALPEPPIHRTEANCWTCGTFAPYDEIAKAQIEEGWIVVLGGKGSESTNVTCPACARKSSKPAAKAAPKKAAAKK